MRWWVFAIWAYVLLALQVGLCGPNGPLAFSSPWGDVEPHLPLVLAVFVGLSAPRATVFVAWAALGFCVDALSTWPLSDQTLGATGVTLIGPYTLAYLAGAYTILEMRSMLFRYHPLTIASMIGVTGVAVSLVVVGLFTVRAWYEPPASWLATSELIRRMLCLVYTAGVGLIVSVPMVQMASLFGFSGQQSKGRRFHR